MVIRIICVGKLKEGFFRDAAREYQKRLSRFAAVEVVEVADEKAPERLSPAQRAMVLEKEGERLLSRIGEADTVVALCIDGKKLCSKALAGQFSDWMNTGRGRISFVIGGSLGLSPAVSKRAELMLSFSDMTFSHQIFRIMLLEQVYRAFKIIHNEPYHK